MRRFYHFMWFWLPPLGFMAAIFSVSSLSTPHIGGETPDYVLHTLEYFLLTLLLLRLLLSRRPFNGDFAAWQRACLIGVVIALAYGISDEIHQYFIPGRHCSLRDVCADSVGAILAYGIAMLDYLFLTKNQAWIDFLKRYKRVSSVSYIISRFPSP